VQCTYDALHYAGRLDVGYIQLPDLYSAATSSLMANHFDAHRRRHAGGKNDEMVECDVFTPLDGRLRAGNVP